MCEEVAPEHFEIGDDGVLHLRQPHPAESERALIDDAVAACPTGALSLEETPPTG